MTVYRLSRFHVSTEGDAQEVAEYLSRPDAYDYYELEILGFPNTREEGVKALQSREHKTHISVTRLMHAGQYHADMSFVALEEGEYTPDDDDMDGVMWEVAEQTPMPRTMSIPGEKFDRVWMDGKWFEPETGDIVAVHENDAGLLCWTNCPDWDVDLDRERCQYVFDADDAAYTFGCDTSDYGDFHEIDCDETDKFIAQYNRRGNAGYRYVVAYYRWSGGELERLTDANITAAEVAENLKSGKYVDGAMCFKL